MESIATWIGTAISIIAAIISIYQAASAKKAALITKKNIIDRDQTSDLTKVQHTFQNALNAMKKYGPASTVSNISGVSHENDANAVQEFIICLNEHKKYFFIEHSNEAEKLCNNISHLINNFVMQKSCIEILRYGLQIFTALNSFSSSIKRQLDQKRYD